MLNEEDVEFDLVKVAEIIRNRQFERVLLQFPDTLLRCSVPIYNFLKDGVQSARFFIAAASTYGGGVDDISARHIQSDLIVSFGDDLSSSGSVPVLVVPALRNLNVRQAVLRVTSATRCVESDHGPPSEGIKDLNVILFYELGYHRFMESLAASACEELHVDKSMVTIARLPLCADLNEWNENSNTNLTSGRNYMNTCEYNWKEDKIGGLRLQLPSKDMVNCNQDCEQSHDEIEKVGGGKIVWYVGDKKQQLLSIMLRLGNVPIVAYFPTSGKVQAMKGSDSREFSERYGGVSKVTGAEIVGIIIGSMGLNDKVTRALVHRLEKMIIHASKKYYTFVMGQLNEAKLGNFPEVDIYCLVSNDDNSLIKPKTFHVPVITPYELELGLGAHSWSVTYFNTSSYVYEDMDINILMSKVSANRPECAYCEDIKADLKNGTTMPGEVLNIDENETSLTEFFRSAAAGRLALRKYQGMESERPTSLCRSLEIKAGKFGIASEYNRCNDNSSQCVPEQLLDFDG